MNKTNIVVRNINTELKRKFKAKAASEGSNMTEKIEQYINRYVETPKSNGQRK